MDNQQRFELLSAYLDQELSPEETKKVEQWLKEDEKAQRTYQNLLQLRYCLREIPVPSSQLPADVLSRKVTAKAHLQRMRQVLLWGGGTIAALFVAIIAGMLSTMNSPLPRLAKSDQARLSSSSLMITVDQPILEIPAAPVSDAASSETEQPSSPSSPTP